MTKKKPLAEPAPISEDGPHHAKVGMRVQVISINKKRNLGLATITKVVELWMKWESGEKQLISKHYPAEITFDDGRRTSGMRCYWYPIKEVNQ